MDDHRNHGNNIKEPFYDQKADTLLNTCKDHTRKVIEQSRSWGFFSPNPIVLSGLLSASAFRYRPAPNEYPTGKWYLAPSIHSVCLGLKVSRNMDVFEISKHRNEIKGSDDNRKVHKESWEVYEQMKILYYIPKYSVSRINCTIKSFHNFRIVFIRFCKSFTDAS